jgi:putative transposase
VELKLIGAGKPNQNAYVESFNGKFQDECLNEHWFMSLAHARSVIGAALRCPRDVAPVCALHVRSRDSQRTIRFPQQEQQRLARR